MHQPYSGIKRLEAFLERARSKPEHVRRRYAFWWSFGATAFIFVIWLASFGVHPGANAAAVADGAAKPAGSMVAAVGSFFGDIKDMLFGAKKIEYSSVEAIPGKR